MRGAIIPWRKEYLHFHLHTGGKEMKIENDVIGSTLKEWCNRKPKKMKKESNINSMET